MPKLDLPPITDEEEARLQAGIASDPDNPEITDEQFAKARSFAEVHPSLAANLRRTPGPQKAPTKQPVTLRIDRDVLLRFKATGLGWQSRMTDILRKRAP